MATILHLVEYLFTFLASNVVHPIFFPYALGPTLHAARVSISFQEKVRRSENYGKHSWGTYLSGFLIMAWSGSIISNLILSVPPPPLYSIHPWINYLSVHFALTTVFSIFPAALSPRMFDTFLFLPDAILRTGTITSALDTIQSHPDPRLSQSLFLRVLVGAIASAGGGVTAATLNVWTPNWTLSTPVFLRKNTSVLSTLDLWAGSLVVCIYDLTLYVSLPTTLSVVDAEHPAPIITPLGARAVAASLLAVLFAWRAAQMHWVTKKTKTE